MMHGPTIGHYEVLQRLGEGGMGVVYRARDTALGREIALKCLSRELTRDADANARFLQEARAASSLDHPNICTIYEIGETDEGQLYLAMALYEDDTLEAMLTEGRLPIARAIDIGVQVARGLEKAHSSGIVHRDVKPANIMFSADGVVKIVDFGIAKLLGTSGMTRTGTALGTLSYMSPEQARGEAIDARTDIWSLGVVLYELTTGRVPFGGPAPASVLYRIVHEPHAPISDTRVPAELVEIIDRCLRKDPAERIQTAAELGRRLHGASARTRPSSGLREAPAGLTAAPVLAPTIRFCQTADGARIAYATVGDGPVLIRVLGWFTHLELEWEWPEMRALWERLAHGHTVVRYDGRGFGMSEPYDGEFTEESRALDLDAVVKAVGAETVTLFGISEGGWTAAHYAVTHPDRVSDLVLYGAYSRGAPQRPDYDGEQDAALITLMRKSWGQDSPGFRQLFTRTFFASDMSPALLARFAEMQRMSADPETATRFFETLHSRGDASDVFGRVRVPTLVVHSREDDVVPMEEGRRLASLIPGAAFVPLPSGTHYFPADMHASQPLVQAIEAFRARDA